MHRNLDETPDLVSIIRKTKSPQENEKVQQTSHIGRGKCPGLKPEPFALKPRYTTRRPGFPTVTDLASRP